ncbi:MAG: IS66 family transposase [Candidatus Nanopelagicales bacterium]
MKSRAELLSELAQNPTALADYIMELQAQVEQKDQLLAEARAYIAELKQQLFGPKADQLTPEQKQQLATLTGDLNDQAQRDPPASEAVLEAEGQSPAEERQKLKKDKTRRPRHPLPPVKLEVQRVVLEPPDRVCGQCGQPGRRLGQEVTTEYDYLPARLIVRELVRPKYARDCACGQPGVSIAPLPPRLVPQSKLGLGLAVYLLLSRFDDHVAYYTLERIFRERYGVHLPRQQMVRWVEQIAGLLQAIYRQIWEELQASGYLQIDETPVKVLDPEVRGKAARGYLWFYAAPGGLVYLEFCASRGREGPRERLKHFQGTMQTDAYEVYAALRRERPSTLKRLGCLAHARRYFYKAADESLAEAAWFIGQIRELYRLEEELRGAPNAVRQQVRRERAPAYWRAMKRRAEALRANPRLLPKSSLGKAVNYFLNDYTALVGYLRDGRFEIDNNLIENAIRPTVVGRKRWLFIGHPAAGWRSAVIYTIILSCRRFGINPQEYLTDVLGALPTMKNTDVKAWVPSRWKPHTAPSA